MAMKIVALSDTHGFHNRIDVPKGDVLIYAGDFGADRIERFNQMAKWFKRQPHPIKLYVPGNHDTLVERDWDESQKQLSSVGVDTLLNTGMYIDGIHFWGYPYIPPIGGMWAFERDPDFRRYTVNKIPSDVDVLISHGPVYMKLDMSSTGHRCGCTILEKKVEEVKPKVFICGHIHESYGSLEYSDTEYYNVSMTDIIFNKYTYDPEKRQPLELEILRDHNHMLVTSIANSLS
jgi:Icc-related predicted phosphoesterase